MKDMEKALEALKKPSLEPQAFKQNLRRELLRAHGDMQKPRSWALWVLSCCAALLGVVVLSFIAKPEWAARSHDFVYGKNQEPLSIEENQLASEELQALLSPQSDQDFVKAWANEQGVPVNANLNPENQSFITVRRYVLDDGRTLEVYTEIPPEKVLPQQAAQLVVY